MFFDKLSGVAFNVVRHIVGVKHNYHLVTIKEHIIAIQEVYSCELFPNWYKYYIITVCKIIQEADFG